MQGNASAKRHLGTLGRMADYTNKTELLKLVPGKLIGINNLREDSVAVIFVRNVSRLVHSFKKEKT